MYHKHVLMKKTQALFFLHQVLSAKIHGKADIKFIFITQ